MSTWLKNNLKFIYATLIIVAILGFFLPAVIIKIDMFGISEGLSVRNVFSILGESTSSQPDVSTSQTKLLELIRGNDVFAEVKGKFVMSVGAYFLVGTLLLKNLAFILLGKGKKRTLAISVIALALFSYAGYTMLSLSKVLYTAMEESLGSLAALINISELLKVNLGIGYWITLATLAIILFIEACHRKNQKFWYRATGLMK